MKSHLAAGETLDDLFLRSATPTLVGNPVLPGYGYVVVGMRHGPGSVPDFASSPPHACLPGELKARVYHMVAGRGGWRRQRSARRRMGPRSPGMGRPGAS
ncbi:hypothetical protein BHM03_00051235 [Ensete ventricosum]|nr:hypothetical protein BHM03_00051235 [Ensete ventricosum]